MILSDVSIRDAIERKYIEVRPEPQDWQYQPASLELTLSPDFLSPYDMQPVHYNGLLSISPGECLLASTVERIELPRSIVGRVEGKSSWGRRFLMVHSTAGFIDPGFKGNITLELKNLSNRVQALPIGAAIAQLSFQWTDAPVLRPYGSDGLNNHYQDQIGVASSAIPWN